MATDDLTDMPNIGPEMARRLRRVGIDSPGQLRAVGSIVAAARMARSEIADVPCRSALCAFEGAVRGIRWHEIPRADRDALWRNFRAHVDGPA